ncbi:MAG TPA: alpha/beta hydrolase [Rhizomicrobium sp.]|nr:alpha/beta hydrolase [Rhizomicrobium sp.]
MRPLAALAVALLLTGSAFAEEIPLRPVVPGDAEIVRLTDQGEHIVSNVRNPSIALYLPAQASGAGVVVIPGGGHRELWMDHEGYRVGAWLAAHGVAAFVLKYRLSGAPGSPYTIADEVDDVQAALRLVRSHAKDWNVSPERLGVIGFSAGGELALLAGTAPDASARPAFMGLIYPAPPKTLTLGANLPPAFLLCGADDSDGPNISEGVPALYLALKHAGGSPEMHILSKTGHGFGMRDANGASIQEWPVLFLDWLQGQGFIARG